MPTSALMKRFGMDIFSLRFTMPSDGSATYILQGSPSMVACVPEVCLRIRVFPSQKYGCSMVVLDPGT